MAISLEQTKTGNGATASATLSGLTSTTAGNLLLFCIVTANNPGNNTFTMPAGWTQVGTTVNENVYIGLTTAIYAYVNNPGGITSVTCTINAAPSQWDAQLLEFSGIATSSPLDVYATAAVTSGTQKGGTVSATTTVAGDLLVGVSFVNSTNGGIATITEPTGWTAGADIADASGWAQVGSAYQVQASAGSASYSPTWSLKDDAELWLVAFEAASGGGGTVAGGGALVATAVLSESAATVRIAGASAQANAALTQGAATLLAAPVAAQANAALSVTGVTLLAGSAAMQANAALTETQAHILADGLTLQGNAALVVAPPVGFVANAALSVAHGQIVTSVPAMASAGALALTSAQLVSATPASVIASALLSAAQAQLVAAQNAFSASALLTLALIRPTQPPVGVSASVLVSGSGPTGVSASASVSQPAGVSATLGGAQPVGVTATLEA